MEPLIVHPGTSSPPVGAAAAYQEEVKLAQEIVEIWNRGSEDRKQLGVRLLRMRNLKAGKGRDGGFSKWLESHNIPRSTAYDLIAAIEQQKVALKNREADANKEDKVSSSGHFPCAGNSEAKEEHVPNFSKPELQTEAENDVGADLADQPAPQRPPASVKQDTVAPESSAEEEEDLDQKLHIKWSHEEQKAFNTCMNLLKGKTGREVEEFMWNLYNRVTARFRVSVMNPPAYKTNADRLEVANG